MNGWDRDVPALQAIRVPTHAGLDPYAIWAVASGWRFHWQMQSPTPGSSIGRTPDAVTVLARTREPVPVRGTAGSKVLEPLRRAGWIVPAVYDRMPLQDDRPVWFTARVPQSELMKLLEQPRADLQWELAVPQREPETVARANPLGLYGDRAPSAYRPTDRSFDEAGGAAADGADRERPDAPPRLSHALAVIDFGCAFLHTQFRARDGERTRLHSVWDQGAPAGHLRSWRTPSAMGYGREIRRPAIDGILERLLDGPADESQAYRQLDHLIHYDDARRRLWAATHGTHVLHVAGGLDDPLVTGAVARAGDPASEAPLVFVQVSSLTASDCSGASMGAAVLDAMHHILDQCTDRARIVVNLSHGTYAGPHDGTSMIEEALDDLLRARPKLAVVLAAGNARQREGHARRTIAPQRSARLRVELVPGDSTPTFVELWYRAHDDSGARLNGVPVLPQLRVRSEDGDWSEWVGPGELQFLCERGWPLVMVRNQHPVDDDRKDMMLVAFAPTMRPSDDDGPLAQPGIWQIEVRMPESAPEGSHAELDAWVERDDPGDTTDGVQPRLLGVDADDARESLSSLCGGPRVIVVGGFRRSDGVQVPYSSVGSTEGHAVMGACEEGRARPGIHAAAVRSGETFLMNGTSVAAPVVARRLYAWMMRADETDFDDDGGWRSRALGEIVEREHLPGAAAAVKHWPEP